MHYIEIKGNAGGYIWDKFTVKVDCYIVIIPFVGLDTEALDHPSLRFLFQKKNVMKNARERER